MRLPDFPWAWEMIRTGQSHFLFEELWARVYKRLQEWLFALRFNVFGQLPPRIEPGIQLATDHPVAFKSPDHFHRVNFLDTRHP